MKENVTVEQALKKGKIKLIYLPMIVMLAVMGLVFFIGINNIIGTWIFPIGILGGFVSSWLVWSYYVVEWKIWAYENVRNINELKRKAINEKLIWSDGSWLEKTEFKNYEQKQKLKQLEKRFQEKDIFHDDLSVPKETVIGFSRSAIILGIIISLFLIATGIYYFIMDTGYIWILLSAAGIYFLYKNLKKMMDKSPQITINDKGIKIKNQSLVPWNGIRSDQVITKSSGKNSTNYLVFNGEEISIDDLDTSFSDLEKLLHVYRVRYEKNNPGY